MGLDNGIVLRQKFEDVKDYFINVDKSFLDNETEICYWRKCWNIREVILKVLHGKDDVFEYPIEAEDIPAIIRAITSLLSPESWENDCGSIWDFDEIIISLITDLANLKLLEKYLRDHPNTLAYFYDSY